MIQDIMNSILVVRFVSDIAILIKEVFNIVLAEVLTEVDDLWCAHVLAVRINEHVSPILQVVADACVSVVISFESSAHRSEPVDERHLVGVG